MLTRPRHSPEACANDRLRRLIRSPSRRQNPVFAHFGRLESTYCGRSRPRPRTPQLGGKQSFRENACRGGVPPKARIHRRPKRTVARAGSSHSSTPIRCWKLVSANSPMSGDTHEGRHILIAVARYLAARSPTERAVLQTADIARRLMRGTELYHDATARDNSRLVTLTLGYFAPDGPGYTASSV